MKMVNEDFRAWLRWAMQSPLRKETMLSLLDQWEEQEKLRQQQPIQEFNTNFNAVRTALENGE
jgi:hypothetical protein